MKSNFNYFKVISIERQINSAYGNPRYRLLLVNDVTGEIVNAKTSPDSIVGYMCHSSMNGGKYAFEYHVTRSGNMIITYFTNELSKLF